MIHHQGRRYVIDKGPITDSHGNTHGWFCRVQSEDGQWRVVTQKHKLERFRFQPDGGLSALAEEVTQGLENGRLVAVPSSQLEARS